MLLNLGTKSVCASSTGCSRQSSLIKNRIQRAVSSTSQQNGSEAAKLGTTRRVCSASGCQSGGAQQLRIINANKNLRGIANCSGLFFSNPQGKKTNKNTKIKTVCISSFVM